MPRPTVDPKLVAAQRHAGRIRAELDRLDTAVSDYEGDARDLLVHLAMDMRVDLDALDALLEAEAAGL